MYRLMVSGAKSKVPESDKSQCSTPAEQLSSVPVEHQLETMIFDSTPLHASSGLLTTQFSIRAAHVQDSDSTPLWTTIVSSWKSCSLRVVFLSLSSALEDGPRAKIRGTLEDLSLPSTGGER